MLSTIENMVKKLIMAEDCSQLMDEIINDQTVQMEKTIIFLFDNVAEGVSILSIPNPHPSNPQIS
jgi:phage-related holin